MEKIIKQLKENKYIHYLIIVIIGIFISINILNIQLLDSHDGMIHMLRLIGTWDTLKLGQIPPLIEPDFCSGMGYSMNLFYPPIVTYVPLLLKLIIPTYTMTLKLFGMICVILSGVTMYNFANEVTKKRSIALFSSIIYMIAPYKLANIYVRYAMGEFVALIFLPILFQGLYNLFKGDGKKHYYIAIATTLLILTHTITTYYTAILCMIFVIFFLPNLKKKIIIKKLIINIFFIVLISLFFIAPMLEANKLADYVIFDSDIMKTTNKYTSSNTIEILDLFKVKDTEVDLGLKKPVTFIIGIPVLILLISTCYCIKKINKNYKDIYIIFLMLSLISIYMTTKFFPWIVMPNILCKLQYPWRMMGFFNFFTSIICGINLYIIINKTLKYDIIKILIIFVLITVSIFYTNNIMKIYKGTNIKADYEFEEKVLLNTKIHHMAINRDYLPVKAIYLQDTYMKTREDKTYILNGNDKILKEEKDKLKMNLEISSITCGTILEFPYIYYPGYEAILEQNGTLKKIKTIESKNGYLAIELSEDIENANLEIEYKGTIITKVTYIISFISTIIFILYIYKSRKEEEYDKENIK